MRRQNKKNVPVQFGTGNVFLSGILPGPMHAGKDRRVIRTQRLLHHALFAVMGEKEYASITVQDIIQKADVGRSTFYAHFQNKDDLLKSGTQMFRAWLFEVQKNARASSKSREVVLGFTLALFEHIYQQQQMFRMMVGRPSGAVIVHRELRQIFTSVVRHDLAIVARRGPGDTQALEATVALVAGALINLTMWWLEKDFKLSPHKIDEIFHGFALPGVLSAFKNAPQREL